jgi:hypothetical protein
MIDSLIRDFQVLWKADTLIGKIWVDVIVRRIGLLAFAGLIAVFGLGMANVAGFYGLQPILGPVLGAAVVAVIDFALGLAVLLVATKIGGGREIELAFDVRSMAVEAIRADALDLKLEIDAFTQEMRAAKETLVGFALNPLDTAAQKLLVPAAISLIRGLRARKQGS